MINYYAVFVSAVVSWVLSYVWFMWLFRKPYMEGLGKTKEQMNKGPSMMVASAYQLMGNIMMALVVAMLIQLIDVQGGVQAIELAVILWVGFVAAVEGPMCAFNAFSLKYFLVTSGNVLMSLLATSIILSKWQ